MIRFNLLPEGYSKSDRTPLPKFAVILTSVAVVASSLALFGYVHFGVLRKAVTERETARSARVALDTDAAYASALEREKAEYRKRSDTIQSIGHSRILWTKKLDQFLDVVNNGGDRERHFIWLKNIDVKPGTANSQSSDRDGGTLTMKGFSGGQHLQRLSDFHADLKRPPFFDDFCEIDDPAGKVVEFDGEYEPRAAWEFELKMRLKPRDAQAAKGTEAKAAKKS